VNAETPIGAPSAVVRGVPAPDFRAPSNKGHTLGPESFQDHLAIALFFLDGLESEDVETFWSFDALLPEFGARRVQLLGVVPATPSDLRERTSEASVTVLADEDGSIRNAFGTDVPTPFTVIVDRHGVVAEVVRGERGDHARSVLAFVDRLLEDRPEDVEVHPEPPGADA
jgi:peroxiredoxin